MKGELKKMEDLLKEFKKKLGYKIGSYVLSSGRDSLGINKYENGFVLRKRKQMIILDRFDLMRLADIIISFEKKQDILKALE